MQANYKKLWKLLIDKDMKKTDLLKVANISSNILAKMNKGENVSMDSLQKICKALECDVGDIVTFEEK
ncbi:helix-turn-helix transcriptional regulator [uncultured Treponema sp.]|uniref:helix-turn-helix domain-containing protein n=1 Tax=uncultured Treponema sp. TaxID=162155 RepID=UPI0027D9CA85|nr:helix-turn-helix transcriptional regulator [uncultured Treponema sp.]